MFILALLQFIDGEKYLSHLIGLGFALVILDVDSWVTRPGRFENAMTGAGLARLGRSDYSQGDELRRAGATSSYAISRARNWRQYRPSTARTCAHDGVQPFLATRPQVFSAYPSGNRHQAALALNTNAAPLLHQRCPVGCGPSLKTCP